MYRARRSQTFIAGAVLTVGLVLVAVLAPLISPYSPDHQDLYNILGGFSSKHLLGTDELGRDELSRLIWATRTDLRLGFLAVIFPFLFRHHRRHAGRLPRWVVGPGGDARRGRPHRFSFLRARDRADIRGRDGDDRASSSPLPSSTGSFTPGPCAPPRSWCASRITWPRPGRAACPRGASCWRHVLPNTVTQAVVYLTNDIVLVIVAVVTLGYLGLGVQPPTPTGGP